MSMKKLTSYLSLLAIAGMISAGVNLANAAPALKGFSTDPARDPNGVAIGGNGTVAGCALPAWFQGQDGVAIKPCLNVANCALIGAPPFNAALPLSYPNNFPEEAFYFNATANFVMPGASDVLVVMAMEYTFVDALGNLVTAATPFNVADPAAGLAQGFPFQRIRLVHTFIGGGGTIPGLIPAPNSSFTVRTPWGTTVFPLALAKCVNQGGDTKCSMTRDLPAGGPPSPLAALGDPVLAPGSISTFLKDPLAPVGFLGTGAAVLAFTGAAPGQLNSVTVTDPLGNTGTTTQLSLLIGQTVGLEVTAPAGTNFGVVKPAGPVLKTININNLAGVAFTPVIAANVPASNPVTVSPDFTIVPSATLPCPTGILTLAAGANCNFDVKFAPIAAGADGLRSADIAITGAGVPPASITVTGIADGTAPVLALTSAKFFKTAAAAQAFTGTASDANGIGAVTVTVDADAAKPATVTGGTWTFTTANAMAAQSDATGLPVHNIVVNANGTALPAPGNAATS